MNNNHFNTAAKTWDSEEAINRNNHFAAAISKYLPKKNLRFLDFGCGTGLLSQHFATASAALLGIDTSVGMLEVFNSKFNNLKQVTSLVIDLENTGEKLTIGLFDVIMTGMAFHHLKNPLAMLGQFKRLLSPSGIIFIIDLDQEDGSFHPDNQAMGVHHFGFSKEDYEAWARETGLRLMAHEIIYQIAKNERKYGIGMAIFTS